jgi:lambda family phage portal protein
VLHLFDLILPGQLRGVPPLIAALTAAQGKATLREYTMAGALVQSMFCATVESDLPNALKGLDSGEGGIPGFDAAPKGTDPLAWLAAHGAYYGEKGISLNPGQVNHLMASDKLKLHRSETPNATYQPFDMSLNREAAKAAGASYEDVSGDYSQTSFSASRLALDLPSRINDRRRKSIAERFYNGVFRAWLEEACETGIVKLPNGAPAFWECPDAYSAAVWRGKGAAVADKLKNAQADILEIENGLSTLDEKLGERGHDFEEIVAQRKAEREQLEAAGLNYPVPQNRDAWQPEDDTAEPVK